MSANMSCPNCKMMLQIPESYHGQRVRCPECSNEFTADAGTGVTAEPPPITPSSAPSSAPSADVEAGWPSTRKYAGYDDDASDDSPVSVRKRASGEYKPATGTAYLTMVLLGVTIIISGVTLASEYMQYQLADRMVKGEQFPEAQLEANDMRQMAIGVVHFLVYIACAITFAVLFYRLYANLLPLGADQLQHTPGWAAGAWFVPLLNLFRPVQIAQEIWRKSDPDTVNDRTGESGNSALIGLWWASWIITNIIAQVAMRVAMNVNSPQSLKTASMAGMVSEVSSIPAALLAIAVVYSLDARQTARAEKLNEIA